MYRAQHRPAELVERRIWHLHLGLPPNRTGNPKTVGGLRGVVEQRALADSGLADQHEHSASLFARVPQQPFQQIALCGAAEQRLKRSSSTIDREHGSHFTLAPITCRSRVSGRHDAQARSAARVAEQLVALRLMPLTGAAPSS